MTDLTPSLRRRIWLGAALVGLLVAMLWSHPAEARPYTVVACDSAGAFGYSSAAWTPFGNAGNAYQVCPSGAGLTTGVSNRMVDPPYRGFDNSGHAFTAPPGTTISHMRWAGRLARDNCRWGTFFRAVPSGSSIIGLRNGEICDSDSFDIRHFPITFRVPDGTTGLQQLVICGASECPPGATLHSQTLDVTVEDPVPPSVSVDGPLASGQWVSGRAADLMSPSRASDNAGRAEIAAR